MDTEADSIEGFTKMPEAQGNSYPVAIRYPVEAEQRIDLDLPAGWRWGGETLHKSVEVPGMSYTLTTGQKDSHVSFVHHYRSTAPYIAGNEVGRYADGLRQVNDLVARRFIVARTDGGLSREDRLSRLVKDILDERTGDTGKPAADGTR